MFRYKWIIYIGIILLFIGISGALFNLKLSVVGKGNIVNNNYSIQYTKDYWYNNGYNYYNFNIILNNNLAVDIDGWSIQIKVPSDIQDINCWNTNCSFSNGVLTATNMYYNSTVLAFNSVSFGIHFYTSTADLELNDFTINSSSYSNNDVILDGVSDYGMSASVSLTNSWSNGNQFVRDYSLIIYNDSGVARSMTYIMTRFGRIAFRCSIH